MASADDYDEQEFEQEEFDEPETFQKQRESISLQTPYMPSYHPEQIENEERVWDDVEDLNNIGSEVFDYDPMLHFTFEITLPKNSAYAHHHISKAEIINALDNHIKATGASYLVEYQVHHLIEACFITSAKCRVDGLDRQSGPSVLFVSNLGALNTVTYSNQRTGADVNVVAVHSGLRKSVKSCTKNHHRHKHCGNMELATSYLSCLEWREEPGKKDEGFVFFPKKSLYADALVALRNHHIEVVRSIASQTPAIQRQLWKRKASKADINKFEATHYIWPIAAFRGVLLTELMRARGDERDIFANGITIHAVTATSNPALLRSLHKIDDAAQSAIEEYRDSLAPVDAERRYTVSLKLQLVAPLPERV